MLYIPLIGNVSATTLLLAIVVFILIVHFLWSRRPTEQKSIKKHLEKITDLEEENTKLKAKNTAMATKIGTELAPIFNTPVRTTDKDIIEDASAIRVKGQAWHQQLLKHRYYAADVERLEAGGATINNAYQMMAHIIKTFDDHAFIVAKHEGEKGELRTQLNIASAARAKADIERAATAETNTALTQRNELLMRRLAAVTDDGSSVFREGADWAATHIRPPQSRQNQNPNPNGNPPRNS